MPTTTYITNQPLLRQLLIISAGITLFTGTAFCRAAPQTACKQTAWDFGRQSSDTTLRHSFTLHNRGEAPLKIKSVNLSCKSCFSADMTRRNIPPKESAKLKITFDLKKSTGKQHKTVLVKTNDPKRPLLTFRIYGKVAASDDKKKNSTHGDNNKTADEENKDSDDADEDDYQNAQLLVFTDPGCDLCEDVQYRIKELENKHPEINKANIDVNSSSRNRFLQMAVSSQLNVAPEHRLTTPMAATGDMILYGDISDEAITELFENTPANPFWQSWNEKKHLAEAEKQVRSVTEDLSIAVLVLAGMADGINPCAFAVIVFLITCLAVSQGRSRRYTLACGLLFCLGVFFFYYLLGFGFLHALSFMKQWQSAERSLMYGGAALSLLFGSLAFMDAFSYSPHGSRPMKFGMPKSLRMLSHRLIRIIRSPGFLLPGAIGLGFLVSGVEAVCTGQIYLPALLIINQQSGRVGPALLLLLYNVCFLLPMLAIVFAAGFGLNSQRLVNWGKRHAAGARLLGGCALIGLGFLLFIMAA